MPLVVVELLRRVSAGAGVGAVVGRHVGVGVAEVAVAARRECVVGRDTLVAGEAIVAGEGARVVAGAVAVGEEGAAGADAVGGRSRRIGPPEVTFEWYRRYLLRDSQKKMSEKNVRGNNYFDLEIVICFLPNGIR